MGLIHELLRIGTSDARTVILSLYVLYNDALYTDNREVTTNFLGTVIQDSQSILS